ncbi:unnamed protein product, partial [Allacma fusca]
MVTRNANVLWNSSIMHLARRKIIGSCQQQFRSKWYLQSGEPSKPLPMDVA